MKNLKYWLAVALLSPASYSFAQYDVDALRFSQTQFGGSARTLGIGGATVALGADLGNLTSNPAGLGLYQQSEFSFTPGLGIGNTDSRYLNSTATDSRNSLHIGSIGAVFANRHADGDGSPWRGGALALGLTRVNDFNRSFRYGGEPTTDTDFLSRLSEPTQDVVDIRNQNVSNIYYSLDGLAYGAYLTDIFTGSRGQDSLVLSDPVYQSGNLRQSETVLTTGSQTQFDFGYGASYRDRLYIGGAIGILSTRYNSTSTLTATDPAAPQPGVVGTAFSSLTYREDLQTRGTGINARIGAIYRLNDAVRLGASIQTPTYSTLSETYNASLNTTFDQPVIVDNQSFTSASASTGTTTFDYALTSPFRASGGLAVVIGKNGFLSGDVEYVNYSQARLSNTNGGDVTQDGHKFGYDNDAIRSLYGSAVNLRLGGELRYDIFRFRLGFARYGDPYETKVYDRVRNYYTAGLGLRQGSFYLDLAGVYATDHRYYNPYTFYQANGQLDTNRTPLVTVDASRFTTSVTAGFLF